MTDDDDAAKAHGMTLDCCVPRVVLAVVVDLPENEDDVRLGRWFAAHDVEIAVQVISIGLEP